MALGPQASRDKRGGMTRNMLLVQPPMEGPMHFPTSEHPPAGFLPGRGLSRRVAATSVKPWAFWKSSWAATSEAEATWVSCVDNPALWIVTRPGSIVAIVLI